MRQNSTYYTCLAKRYKIMLFIFRNFSTKSAWFFTTKLHVISVVVAVAVSLFGPVVAIFVLISAFRTLLVTGLDAVGIHVGPNGSNKNFSNNSWLQISSDWRLKSRSVESLKKLLSPVLLTLSQFCPSSAMFAVILAFDGALLARFGAVWQHPTWILFTFSNLGPVFAMFSEKK